MQYKYSQYQPMWPIHIHPQASHYHNINKHSPHDTSQYSHTIIMHSIPTYLTTHNTRIEFHTSFIQHSYLPSHNSFHKERNEHLCPRAGHSTTTCMRCRHHGTNASLHSQRVCHRSFRGGSCGHALGLNVGLDHCALIVCCQLALAQVMHGVCCLTACMT